MSDTVVDDEWYDIEYEDSDPNGSCWREHCTGSADHELSYQRTSTIGYRRYFTQLCEEHTPKRYLPTEEPNVQ